MAWWATGWFGRDGMMRVGILTAGPPTGGAAMPHAPMAVGLFLGMWAVMMAAMMLPSALPVILLVRRWAASRQRSRAAAAFTAGYIGVWAASGGAAYGLVWALQAWVPPGSTAAARVGGGLLVLAGVHQLSPLKDRCLAHCRSPLGFLTAHAAPLRRGVLGTVRVGVHHGVYCLGCCWALMVVLVLVGMMSLAWMGVIAAVVAAEKVLPGGVSAGRLVGILLGAAGMAVLLVPGLVAG